MGIDDRSYPEPDEHQDWHSQCDRDLITFGYSERDPLRDDWTDRLGPVWDR